MAQIKQIQFKRSNVAGKRPTIDQLAEGELALNIKDRTMYTRNADGQIIDLNLMKGGTIDGGIGHTGNYIQTGNYTQTGKIYSTGEIVSNEKLKAPIVETPIAKVTTLEADLISAPRGTIDTFNTKNVKLNAAPKGTGQSDIQMTSQVYRGTTGDKPYFESYFSASDGSKRLDWLQAIMPDFSTWPAARSNGAESVNIYTQMLEVGSIATPGKMRINSTGGGSIFLDAPETISNYIIGRKRSATNALTNHWYVGRGDQATDTVYFHNYLGGASIQLAETYIGLIGRPVQIPKGLSVGVAGISALGDASIALGDNDTGLRWRSDGEFFTSNNGVNTMLLHSSNIYNNRPVTFRNTNADGLTSVKPANGTSLVTVRTDTDGNNAGDGSTHIGRVDGNGNFSHLFRGNGDFNIANAGGLTVSQQAVVSGRIWANAGIIMQNDSVVEWSRNSDYAKISFKNTADSDTDSYMKFNTGDDGNEYFKFVSTNGTAETTWADIKNGQVVPANYGNFDARYINKTGTDTMQGRLTFAGGFSTNTVPNGNTYHWTAWKTSTSESKTYLRGFRSWSGGTMWHETVTGGEYRLATGTTDSLDVLKLDQNALTLNGEIRPGDWTNLDARFLNTAGDTATGEMIFNANVVLGKELYFRPSDNRSKDIFGMYNWGDGTDTGRSQVLEIRDTSGYHFYTQRCQSDKQVSASFAGNVAINGTLSMTGRTTFNNGIYATDQELTIGRILLDKTANNVARTIIGQWSTATGTNHRFEIYSYSVGASPVRKDIISADVTNANAANASVNIVLGGSAVVGGSADVRGDLATKGVLTVGAYRPCIILQGTGRVNGAGAFADQGNVTAFAGLYHEIDDAGTSVYNPLIKQRYKQGNLTWSQGTLTSAGDWVIHFKDGVGAAAGDRSWYFRKSGSFTSPGDINTSGNLYTTRVIATGDISTTTNVTAVRVITSGDVNASGNVTAAKVLATSDVESDGYLVGKGGLKVDSILKVDGTQFIASDGNINLVAPTNGFAAGWLLGQIDNRLNTAQTAANNAQTTADSINTKAVTGVRQGGAVSPGKANEYGPNEAPEGGYLTRAWHDSGTAYGVFFTYRILQVYINGSWRNIGR